MTSALQSVKNQRDAVNSLVDSAGNFKMSTLVNAAKISPHVQERTIGPKGFNGLLHGSRTSQFQSNDIDESSSITTKNHHNNNESSTNDIDQHKLTPENWKFRRESEIDQSPRNMFRLNDCLAVKNAERQRRAKILTDLQEKQCQWDSELEQRLQQIRIDSAEYQKAKRLERERQTLKAIEKIEAEAEQDEIQNDAKNTEIIQTHKETSHQNGSGDSLEAKYLANIPAPTNESLKSSTSEPSHVANNANEISVPDGVAHAGAESRISIYTERITYYHEYVAQIQPLLDDSATHIKEFRFKCKKGVNTPVSSISAASAKHLQDKMEKLSDLLSGKQVGAADDRFSAAEHPLGIKLCTFLLAEKLITQGTIAVSSNASDGLKPIFKRPAFPIAAIIVSIWQQFPDFGKLFLALLYIECPFFIPCVPQKGNLTEHQYHRLIGYKFNDDRIEEREPYLKRISGLQRLYSAVLITKLKQNQQHIEHPHSLENGWIWFTNYLMLDPLPGISPTLLLEFIKICGSEMLQVYKNQFMKLLFLLHNHYLAKLEMVDSGGPYSRLKDLVNNIVIKGEIAEPIGTLELNFW